MAGEVLDTKRQAEYAQHQRDYYATHVRVGMAPQETPYTLRHLNEVLTEGGFRPGARLLDVGCGMGRFSFLMAARGFEVESLDVAPFMIEKLREHDAGRGLVRAHCADLLNAPSELEGRFDGVVGFFMLHHFEHLRPVLPAVARFLKPGGKAVFVEPNPWNPLYYLQIATRPDMKWSAEKGMLNLRRRPVFDEIGRAGLVWPRRFTYGFLPPFLRNASFGNTLEGVLENFPGIEPVRPFQVISFEKRAS